MLLNIHVSDYIKKLMELLLKDYNDDPTQMRPRLSVVQYTFHGPLASNTPMPNRRQLTSLCIDIIIEHCNILVVALTMEDWKLVFNGSHHLCFLYCVYYLTCILLKICGVSVNGKHVRHIITNMQCL